MPRVNTGFLFFVFTLVIFIGHGFARINTDFFNLFFYPCAKLLLEVKVTEVKKALLKVLVTRFLLFDLHGSYSKNDNFWQVVQRS
jgi:hypothetical protein